MTPHPSLLEIPGIETLSSFESRSLPTRSCRLRSIPDEQVSISSPDDDEKSWVSSYGSGHEARLRWAAALRSSPVTFKKAADLESCGRGAWVERNPCSNKYRVVSPACKLRFCPRCSHIHASRTKLRLESWATAVRTDSVDRLRLVTLTLRSVKSPLSQQLDFLYRSYRKLRQRALWKKATNGAIAVLQVTYNAATDLWHPHLHIVQHGRFIDWHALKSAWSRITHGSDGVDIRPVRDVDKACEYVCRYVSRPLDAEHDMPDRRLVDYVMSTKGRRLLIASGNAPLVLPDKTDDAGEWYHVDSLAGLLQRARNGDVNALAIIDEIRSSEPVTPDGQLPLFDDCLDDDAADIDSHRDPPTRGT